MPTHFSRHEQFLRIFALLEILSKSHGPLDDQSLIAEIKDRLGLSRLSPRTLHRDCDFLLTCGYPVDRATLAGDRRFGWHFSKAPENGKKLPVEPLTLLELVSFSMARDLLQAFEGTVLWTGIESLRHKLERDLTPEMRTRLTNARRVFHVEGIDPSRYSGRPRLISTLSAAITDCREIDVEEQAADGSFSRLRVQPHRLVIRPPTVELLGYPAGAVEGAKPVLLDIARIQKVTPLDVTFVPRPIEPEPE
jgi:predicted DNA-binding transcriptional regulator YafY